MSGYDKTVFDVEVDPDEKKIILTVITQKPVRSSPPTEDRLMVDEDDDTAV